MTNSENTLSEEMVERLHDWFEVPTKAALYREVAAWLAAHDRVVAAQAWDEGFKQGGPMHDADMNDPDAHKRNPYRTEESN